MNEQMNPTARGTHEALIPTSAPSNHAASLGSAQEILKAAIGALRISQPADMPALAGEWPLGATALLMTGLERQVAR